MKALTAKEIDSLFRAWRQPHICGQQQGLPLVGIMGPDVSELRIYICKSSACAGGVPVQQGGGGKHGLTSV